MYPPDSRVSIDIIDSIDSIDINISKCKDLVIRLDLLYVTYSIKSKIKVQVKIQVDWQKVTLT